MVQKIKAYIKSFRLRTLPLSMSGIILGSLIAATDGMLDGNIFHYAILTTLSLQILSNVANELGDALKGTDSEERLGPKYSAQSGALTIVELKRTVITFIIISALLGSLLVWEAFGSNPKVIFSTGFYTMLALGALAILAALGYTLGKKPYGYMALGDLGVFLFFGLLSVMGSYFLMTKTLHFTLLLPAAACGFLSMGVLNLNNMRDIESDRRTRLTLPMILGLKGAKVYHTLLISMSQVCFTLFILLKSNRPFYYIFLIFLPLWIIHIIMVWKRNGKELDSLIPPLSIGTLLQCTLFGASLCMI